MLDLGARLFPVPVPRPFAATPPNALAGSDMQIIVIQLSHVLVLVLVQRSAPAFLHQLSLYHRHHRHHRHRRHHPLPPLYPPSAFIMAAAASDKARFYMEGIVPQLNEFKRKGVYSQEEINNIVKKRSEFEHIISSPGHKASDYVRYFEYEMNLAALTRKRCAKRQVKASNFTGEKKIFDILDRSVRRFPGDLALWIQYMEWCKKKDARKKLADVLTRCLRMHPLNYSVWVWVAKMYYEDQADMSNARNYMQRGLRFCKKEKMMWLEYAKLEMLYVAKLNARQTILGLTGQQPKKAEKLLMRQDEDDNDNDMDADVIALPDVTGEELQQGLEDESTLQREAELRNVAESPALSGAIPQIIFDQAMNEFNNDPTLAERFFDTFALFHNVPCTDKLLRRVIDHIASHPTRAGDSAVSLAICNAKMEMLGMTPESALQDEAGHFPLKLSGFLKAVKNGMASSSIQNAALAEKATLYLLPYLAQSDDHASLDHDVERVLRAAIKGWLRLVADAPARAGLASGPTRIQSVTRNLLKAGLHKESSVLLDLASDSKALAKTT